MPSVFLAALHHDIKNSSYKVCRVRLYAILQQYLSLYTAAWFSASRWLIIIPPHLLALVCASSTIKFEATDSPANRYAGGMNCGFYLRKQQPVNKEVHEHITN